MPQLDFSVFPSQFFWLTICFFVMLFVFSRFIIPKTAEMINLRKAKIDDYLEKADLLKIKIEKTLDKYNQALKKATDEANLSLQETRQEMDAMVERKYQELDDNIKKQMLESEAEINKEKDNAIKQLNPTVEKLTLEILKKLDFDDVKISRKL